MSTKRSEKEIDVILRASADAREKFLKAQIAKKGKKMREAGIHLYGACGTLLEIIAQLQQQAEAFDSRENLGATNLHKNVASVTLDASSVFELVGHCLDNNIWIAVDGTSVGQRFEGDGELEVTVQVEAERFVDVNEILREMHE